MALQFSTEQNWADKKALAFAFCENEKGLREQSILTVARWHICLIS